MRGAGRTLAIASLLIALLAILGCRPVSEVPPPSAGGGQSPSTPAPPPVADHPRPADERAEPVWFSEVLEGSGVTFRQVSGNSPQKPFPAANGSGLATFDFDLDGRYDLYFCTGAEFPLDPARSIPTNRLFRNVGPWDFSDVTEQAGAGPGGFCAGVAAGDFDADGFPDLYVTRFGPNCLLRNRGDGTFERVETAARVDDPRWGTSAAFLDYDEDGLLDLYVCNYAKWTWENNPYCGDKTRRIRMHCGPRSIEGEPDVLYHNEGDGTFRETRDEAGVGALDCRGQGVVAADVNGDGHVDLYVGNDLQPNFLFLGGADGRFRDATESSGAAYDGNGAVQASMGVDCGDINHDGLPDLFTTNFQLEHNTLYENLGQALFLDASGRYGVVADSLVHVGWGTQFADFDLDGWLDLIVTNGHVDDNRQDIGENAPYEQPALLYRNDSAKFRRLKKFAGTYFAQPHCGRGLAVCDLDNDGDLDVAIMHQDERPALLRNERLTSVANDDRTATSSMCLRLIGRRGNRDAVGASLTLRSPYGVVRQQVKGGGSYLSAPDLRQTFAVPADATGDELELTIRWPRGTVTSVPGLRPGLRAIVVEPADPASPAVLIPYPE